MTLNCFNILFNKWIVSLSGISQQVGEDKKVGVCGKIFFEGREKASPPGGRAWEGICRYEDQSILTTR